MASVRLVKQVVAKLKELDGTDLNDEAYAEELIEVVEEFHANAERLLVVGQVQPEGDESLYTVALGPFTARGTLDTEAKWDKAAKESTKAHEAGGKLAWHTTSKKGRGRYMVVPIFKSPRDVWDTFGGGAVKEEVTEYVEATNDPIVPVCSCGNRKSRFCYRHGRVQ